MSTALTVVVMSWMCCFVITEGMAFVLVRYKHETSVISVHVVCQRRSRRMGHHGSMAEERERGAYD